MARETRAVTLIEGPGGQKIRELEELVADQAKDAERREELFKDAFDRNLDEKERLERLFDDARKKVSEEKDPGRPPSPFDLD